MNPSTLFDDATGPATRGPVVAHALGKCPAKGCRVAARIALPATWRRTERRVSSYGERYELETTAPAVVLTTPAGRRAVPLDELVTRRWVPHCAQHRRPLRFALLRGTLNTDKPCNARCMGATGPSCECACAGRNHGGRWGA